ncbi:hypothetical protein [uncultured Lutibacter sp.]|uniref:hypothetical protein n=1 Tax=uncultured Lutibacter sp. TaxID=437739 RepID=UPI00260E2876|nr:hypothetical protein [uncultured Lutibacter sp.]
MSDVIKISKDVMSAFFPNSDEHKQCYDRLLKRTQEAGFSSLQVHPSFQKEHNKNGKHLVYMETKNLFYATDNPSAYVLKCVREGVKPESICAINKKGEYMNIHI